MLLPAPPLYPRKRKPRPRGNQPAPPVGPLVLVGAQYDAGAFVELFFDRAIDVAGLDGGVIVVDDGAVQGYRYEATGPVTVTGASSVRIELNGIEEYSGPDVRLTATAANGIVAVGDGGAWAGVTNVAIPFP